MSLPFRLIALQRDDAAYIENKHLEYFIELARERERRNPDFGQLVFPIADGVINFHLDSKEWSRTYGLGLRQNVSDQHLDELESIYRERNIVPHIEVCSLAEPELFTKLGQRRYAITEWASVLIRPFRDDEIFPEPADGITIEEVDMRDEEAFAVWRETTIAGFSTSDDADVSDPDDLLVYHGSSTARHYLARYHGEPAGTAAMAVLDEIGYFASAATDPRFRQKGAHTALINHRLSEARNAGCKVSTVYTLQSSDSQANMQRYGFYIMYNQVNFRKEDLAE
jgi:GNAT superfamily N-acetyltransferase